MSLLLIGFGLHAVAFWAVMGHQTKKCIICFAQSAFKQIIYNTLNVKIINNLKNKNIKKLKKKKEEKIKVVAGWPREWPATPFLAKGVAGATPWPVGGWIMAGLGVDKPPPWPVYASRICSPDSLRTS